MTESNVVTTCALCGTPLDSSLDAVRLQGSCPNCGDTRRNLDVSLDMSGGGARIGMTFKAKHADGKRPHVELKIGPAQSHALSKPVEHMRLIDRGNDQYQEKVADYESGEVIHQADEPLSSHIDHGTAKVKR